MVISAPYRKTHKEIEVVEINLWPPLGILAGYSLLIAAGYQMGKSVETVPWYEWIFIWIVFGLPVLLAFSIGNYRANKTLAPPRKRKPAPQPLFNGFPALGFPACRLCGAMANRPCVDGQGNFRNPHRARLS